MKQIYLILILSNLISSCATKGLSGTCDRFGMNTARVDVTSLDHDELGKGFTSTKFYCVPKKVLKKL